MACFYVFSWTVFSRGGFIYYAAGRLRLSAYRSNAVATVVRPIRLPLLGLVMPHHNDKLPSDDDGRGRGVVGSVDIMVEGSMTRVTWRRSHHRSTPIIIDFCQRLRQAARLLGTSRAVSRRVNLVFAFVAVESTSASRCACVLPAIKLHPQPTSVYPLHYIEGRHGSVMPVGENCRIQCRYFGRSNLLPARIVCKATSTQCACVLQYAA